MEDIGMAIAFHMLYLSHHDSYVLMIDTIHRSFLWYTESAYVTGFTKTVPIGTRNEIQFIADY